MNKGIYRLVFNAARAVWMAVGEYVRGHVAGSGKRRRHAAGPLVFILFFAGVPVYAGTLAVDTLPTGLTVTTGVHTTINAPVVNPANSAGQLLQIQQGDLKAILQGTNFSIGSASEVRIDSTTGAHISTLFRITGPKSVIEGPLASLNGDVYLINQNGILFGNGARVNVHGLVASALDIKDSDFLNDLGHLYPITDRSDTTNYPNGRPAYVWGGDGKGFSTALVQVDPDARIKAGLGGSVMLFAPTVINKGSIETTEGQVVMAAGAKVYLSYAPDPNSGQTSGNNYAPDSPYRGLAGVLVEVDPYIKQASDVAEIPAEITGKAINDIMGRILAQRGNVTMASFLVNQSGRITATSSVTQKGSIRLLARDTKVEGDISSDANVIGSDGKTSNVGSLFSNDSTKNTLISASRSGTLQFGDDSVTAVLPEDAAAIAKTKEILGAAQAGEPTPHEGEKSYLNTVLAAVQGGNGAITDDQAFNQPTVEAIGHTVTVGDNAKIVAPGGYITLSAQSSGKGFNLNNTRDAGSHLYLGKNSLIDAAGLKNMDISMDRNFVEVLLTLNDLQDDPLNKYDFLYHKKVWFDIRDLPDTRVANLAGYLKQVPRTLGEKLAAAGSVKLQSEGDLVQRAGSRVDVSGGSLNYAAGTHKETWLVDANGKAYALGSAPADTVFTGFLGNGNAITTAESGYTEGKAAGTLTLNAWQMALDGTLAGGAVYGEHQRDAANLGGTLVIGDAGQTGSTAVFKVSDVDFINGVTSLDDSYAAGAALPTARADTVQLDAGMLNRSGFEDMAVYADGNIRVNAALALPVKGKLTLTGRNVEVNSNIVARGGSIALNSQNTRDSADYASLGVNVGNGVVLDVSGLWVNNYLNPSDAGRIVTRGGSITVNSGDEAVLGKGSLLDVSGGGWLQSSGKVKAGDAGSISIAGQAGQTSNTGYTYTAPVLNGELRGYALGAGGSLSITAPFITVGNSGIGDARELLLTPEFFQKGGFTSYSMTGRDGVLVRSGTQVNVAAKNFQLKPGNFSAATGSHVADFATTALLPDYLRSSTSLALSTRQEFSNAFAASGIARGSVVVEPGAALRVDSNGNRSDSDGKLIAPRIALDGWDNQVYVDGTLQAAGGKIALTMNGDVTSTTDDGYNAAQAVWLGSNARLLAAGYARTQPDASGLRKGTVYDGGSIDINAKKGYIVAEQGSLLDVSGAAATFDVLKSNRYTPTSVASNGGAITLQAREGMLLDAAYRAASPGALGGGLDVRLTRGTSTNIGNNFPHYPGTANNAPDQKWYVDLAQSGTFTPAGLHAGDALQPQAGGLARIAADRIMEGGFSSVALESEYGVRFNGDVSLNAPRMLRLDVRLIEATPGSNVVLSAPDVMLGDIDGEMRPRDSFTAPAPVSGNSTLEVKDAQLIDMRGQFALSGFKTASFNSSGDIRLTGFSNASTVAPAGMLRGTGELDFSARQVYPTSLSAFTIAAEGAESKVSFAGTGEHDTVLSAGGSLTVNAETIDQGGVLLAPFGTIALNASKSITLESGSLTSVSANGALIPFGYTDRDGLDYLYNFGAGAQTFTAPPERVVKLTAPNVKEAAGSTVDISGGDLFAYEWVPGTGGSADVLANGAKLNAFGNGTANTWAIMPASTAPYGSYDAQYWQGSGINAGDAVYLSGAPNLKDGYYTLLPARYALLPGAMLVSSVTGHQDMPDGQALTQVNGSTLVSGHLGAYTSAGYVSTSRTGGFVVRPGSDAHKLAEYNDTLASTHFESNTQALLPADAGRLSVAATNSLVLDGVLKALHENGRGAEVDIAAPDLLVVDHGATTGAVTLDGKSYLAVDENTLANMNAASLLLGGTRSNGVVDVVSSEVRVGANASVSGPEVILAATDKVRLQNGAKVTGSGSGAPARDLTIGATGGADGDGALLRVAGGAEASLTRNNTSRSRGDLVIDAGATVHGDGSMLLDATHGMSVAGTLGFNKGAALTVAAGRISLGAPDGGAQIRDGLWLTQGQLVPLEQAGKLALQSYSTIDLYGALDIGNANLDLKLQGAGIAGYQNADKKVNITARTFTLANDANAKADDANFTAADGAGALNVQAETIVSGNNTVRIAGFSQADLNASKEIVAQGAGTLSADRDMTLTAARVTAQSGANHTLQATGLLTLQGATGTQTALAAAQAQGAKLKLSGALVRMAGETTLADGTVRHGAAIDIPGGKVTLEATGANTTDNVTLENGSRIQAQGSTYTLYDQSVALPAGTVELTSQHGNVDVQNGALIDLSAADGGDAGTLKVSAVNGKATLAGTVKGGKNAQANLDAGMVSNFSQALNTLREFFGNQSYRVRTGDVTIDAADNVTAGQFVLAADGGAITVNGKVDASGDKGGSIELYAKNDLTVNRGAQLLAQGQADTESTAGTNGKGGTVVLSSDSGTVKAVATDLVNADHSVMARAMINVSGDQKGTVKGESGHVVLRAARTGTDNVAFSPVITAGTSTAFTATVSGFTLTPGVVVAFQPNVNGGASAKLNVNGTGLKSLMKDGGTAVAASDIKSGKTYLAVYDGANFQLVAAASLANGSDAVGTGVKVDAGTTGAIKGAGAVQVEAVRVYEKTTIDSKFQTLLAADTTAFATRGSSVLAGFSQTRDGVSATLAPGVEVRASNGKMTLSSDWDLGSAASTTAGIPMIAGGILTLRAKDDLAINGNLNYEQYTISTSATATQLGNLPVQRSGSWSYRLAAGADFTSASPEQVTDGIGIITLAANKYVRTGAGFIDASAGNNISLGSGAAIYTEGLPDQGYPDQFTGLAPSASTSFINYKTYRELYPDGGGNVRLTAGGDITGAALDTQTANWLLRGAQYSYPLATNPQLRWWPRMLNTSTSSSDIAIKNLVGTMGGGDVTLRAGGSVKDIQVAAASNGRIGGSTSQPIDEANFSERGGGDVAVTVGKDMGNTLLVVGKGTADAHAGGDLSATFALMDGSAKAVAAGDVTLNGVYNPTAVTAPTVASTTSYTNMYFYSYGQNSGVNAISASGNVVLKSSTNYPDSIYPANLLAAAPLGDVKTDRFTLYPSVDGNVTLLAAHDVNTGLSMSDADPSTLSTVFTQPSTANDVHSPFTLKFASFAGSNVHTAGGLHANDTEPVRIYAGNDVVFQPDANSESVFPKPVEIRAGNDVVDANLIVQNLHSTDVSVIEAGNSIRYSDPVRTGVSIEKTSAGIQVAGPGRLHLLAGGNVDLGASDGVRSVGDLYNPYLPAQGADIMVQPGAAAAADYAGMIAAYLDPATAGSFSATYLPQLVQYMRERNGDSALTSDGALAAFRSLDKPHQAQFVDTVFFAELRAGGRDAIDSKSSSFGDYTQAERAILRMFPDFTSNGSLVSQAGSLMNGFARIADEAVAHPGDLNLFYSQIRSERGGRVELLVPGGMVNAGLAVSGALNKPSVDLGIVSVRGGEVDAMVRGNFQVNQSRVFTLGGSDLMLVSALADIDAGRGAKTASATPPPVLRITNGQVSYDYSGAVSGSGIAALIATGGKPGTVDLFAPYGEINAGEAGVRSAGNINLGAARIVGADNITAGGVTSGVPVADTSGLSLGIGGATDPTSSGKSGDQLAQAQAASQPGANQDSFLPTLISVEVIGLGSEEQDEKKKKENHL